MHLSLVSTVFALAATVSGGVLRNASPLKPLASRDVSPVPQLSVRDTVVEQVTETEVITYADSVTTYFTDCYGQVQSITVVDKVVEVLTTTITKITTDAVPVDSCGCQGIQTTTYQSKVTAIFAQVQLIIDYLPGQFPDYDFDPFWKQFGTCTQGFVTLAATLQIDIKASVKIDLGILGINIGIGLGVGVGAGGGGGGGINIGVGIGGGH